jgi:hypothetical protein
LLVMAFALRRTSHEAIHVIDQVHRYPGHERWIAVPRDVLSTGRYEALCKACRRKGVGLLAVGRGGNVTAVVHAQHASPTRELLGEYRPSRALMIDLRSPQHRDRRVWRARLSPKSVVRVVAALRR